MAEKIISKGFYTHPVIPNFVCAKQYVVINKGKENQLFFRFANPKNETLTALSFSVDCYDADGRVIKNVKVEQQGLKAKGRSCFVVNRPVVLEDGCLDFKVTVHSARYGDYLYITHGDDVESIYEKQDASGEIDRVPFLYKLGGLTHRAISKTIHTPRFFCVLIALILASLFAFLGVRIYDFTRTETLFTLDKIEYTFATDNREDGPIIIIGSRSNASNIIIPDAIEGHDVIAVESGAFSRSSIRTIRFEGSIEIRDNAFWGSSNLRSVSIESTKSLGEKAFFNCSNLTEVVIEKDLETIGKSAFGECGSLVSVSLPNSLDSIGDAAFAYCDSLSLLVIPDATTRIGKGIAFGCNSLGSLQTPFIGASADDIDNLRYFFEDVTPDSLHTVVVTKMDKIKTSLFGNESSLKTVKFTSPVKEIGAFAFSGCTNLERFDIPSSVEYIGNNAFAGCSSLLAATVPEKVTSIYDHTFSGCTALTTVNLPSSLSHIGESAFRDCASLQMLNIPFSVTYIGNSAIFGCRGLTELTLPFLGRDAFDAPKPLSEIVGGGALSELRSFTLLSGTALPNSTFSDCEKLTTVTLPDDLISIGDYCFKNCFSLGAIEIPDTVTSIGEYAFADCNALASIEIPEIVGSVGANAFSNCKSLASVTFHNNNTVLGEGIFSFCEALRDVTLPAGLQRISSRMCEGCVSLGEIALPSSLTFIGDDAFSECRRLYSVINSSSDLSLSDLRSKFPAALRIFTSAEEKIQNTAEVDGFTLLLADDGAWYLTDYARGSTFVRLPSNVRFASAVIKYALPGYLFYNDSDISKLNISSDVTKIFPHVFSGCSSLTDVTSDATTSFEEICEKAFYNSPIQNVTLPSSVQQIGAYAFAGTSIKSINIPASLMSIGNSAFRDCYSLKNVTIETGSRLASIGESAFSNSTIRGITFPASLTSIGQNAFYCCQDLESVAFEEGSSLSSVGNYAFYDTAITSISFPGSLTTIGERAFFGCDNLRSVTLRSAPGIGNEAFWSCGALFEVYNLGGLALTIGSDSYGSLAKNAIIVHTNPNAESLCDVSVNGLAFKKSDDHWFLMGLSSVSHLTELVLDSFSYNGSTVSSYVVYKSAFENNSSITSVTVGHAVREIMPYAFSGCSGITALTFAENSVLTAIPSHAFAYCSGIRSLMLPKSITEIGENAFVACGALEKVLLPENLGSIGSDAFLDCRSLYDVMNVSDLSIAQNSNNGYVGYYALAIRRSNVPLPVTTIAASNTSARFVKHNNVWYLVGLDVISNTREVEIPKLIINGVSYNYQIFSYALRLIPSYYNVLLYDSVTKIDEKAWNDLRNRTIYFHGNTTAWDRLDEFDINSVVYTYSPCIHTAGTSVWRYDKNGNITTAVADTTEQIITAATCKDTGVKKIICNACAEERTVTLPVSNEHTFVDDVCSVCERARRIAITEENFDSCGLFENDAAYPFVFDGSGVLVSANHNNSTTATLKMMATSKTVVSFSYKVNSERSADYFRVYLNGSQKVTITGTTSYEAFSIVLNAGDVLSFTYQKDGSVSTGNDCGYIKDLTVIITEPLEA